MDESILNSIKKLLGISETYVPFDQDIIIHINTFLGVLNQMGVGKPGFHIEDENATWGKFLEGFHVSLYEVKTYVYLRVKMVFDPPGSGIVTDAFKQNIDELGWRLNVKVDPEETSDVH